MTHTVRMFEATSFKSNPVLDAQQVEYSQRYDVLFAEILNSEKGSPEHLALLEQESIIYKESSKFHCENEIYFKAKRDSIINDNVPITQVEIDVFKALNKEKGSSDYEDNEYKEEYVMSKTLHSVCDSASGVHSQEQSFVLAGECNQVPAEV